MHKFLRFVPALLASALFLNNRLWAQTSTEEVRPTVEEAAFEPVKIITYTTGALSVCADPFALELQLSNDSESAIYVEAIYPGLPENIQLLVAPTGWQVQGSGADLAFIPSAPTTIAVGDKLSLTYTITAGCDLLTRLMPGSEGTENPPLIVNNQTRFQYLDAEGNRFIYFEPTLTNDGQIQASASYNILYPDLNLETIENSQITSFFDQDTRYTRRFRLVNYGKGILYKARLYVAYDLDIKPQTFTFDGETFTLILDEEKSTTAKHVYFLDLEKAEGFIPQEYFYFEDVVSMQGCSASAETEFWVEWGCGEQICNIGNPEARATAYINLPGGTPQLPGYATYEILDRTLYAGDAEGKTVEYTAKFKIKNNAAVRSDNDRYASAAFNLRHQSLANYALNNSIVTEVYFWSQDGQQQFLIYRPTFLEKYINNSHYDINIRDFGKLIDDAIAAGYLTEAQASQIGLQDLDSDGKYNDLLAGDAIYMGYRVRMDMRIYESMFDWKLDDNIYKYLGNRLTYQYQVGCERYTNSFVKNKHLRAFSQYRSALNKLSGPEYKAISPEIFTFKFHLDDSRVTYNLGAPHIPSTRYEGDNGYTEIVITAPSNYVLQASRAYYLDGKTNTNALQNVVTNSSIEGDKIIYTLVTKYKAARLYYEFDFSCGNSEVDLDEISIENRYYMHREYPAVHAVSARETISYSSPCRTISEIKTTDLALVRASFGKVGKSGTNQIYTLEEYLAAPDKQEGSAQRLNYLMPNDRFSARIGGINEGQPARSFKASLQFTGNKNEILSDYFPSQKEAYDASVLLNDERWLATINALSLSQDGTTLFFDISLADDHEIAAGQQFTVELATSSAIYSYPTNGVYQWNIQAGLYQTEPNILINKPLHLYYYSPGAEHFGEVMYCNSSILSGQVRVTYANYPGEYRALRAIDEYLLFIPKGFKIDPAAITFQQWGTNKGNYVFNEASGYNVRMHDLRTTDLSQLPASYQLEQLDDLHLYSYFVTITAQRDSEGNISGKVPIIPSYINYHTRIYANYTIDPEYQYVFSDENLPEDRIFNSRIKTRLKVVENITAEHEEIRQFNWRAASLSYRRKPKLAITANRIQEGYAREVAWPVQVCNEGTNNTSVGTFVAVELAPDDNISELLRVELKDGTVIDLNSEDDRVVKYTKNGRLSYMVRLGNLGRSSCGYITIVGGYKDEGDIQEDRELILNAYAGSLCGFENGLVDQLVADDTKGMEWLDTEVLDRTFKRLDLILRYRSANLQWRVDQIDQYGIPNQEAVGLCEEVSYEVNLESTRLGNIYDLGLRFDLPYGVSLQDIQYLYPESNTYQSLAAQYYSLQQAGSGEQYTGTEGNWVLEPERFSIYQVDIAKLLNDLDGIEDGYLPGTRNEAANEIRFKIVVREDCDFDPGQSLYFNVRGTTNARRPINLASLQKIRLEEFPLDELNLNLTAKDITSCSGYTDLTLTLDNVGNLSTQPEVLYVQLPAGISYTQTLANTLNAEVRNVTNGQAALLEWSLPAGTLAGGESKLLRIRLRDNLINDTSLHTFTIKAYTRMNGQASCVLDGSQCPLVATTSGNNITLNSQRIKPEISFTVTPDEFTLLCADQESVTIKSTLTYPVVEPFGEISGRTHTYYWYKKKADGTHALLKHGNGTSYSQLVIQQFGYDDTGSYRLRVRDRQSGCFITKDIELLPEKFHPDFSIQKLFSYDESCNNASDGTIGFRVEPAGKEVAERNFTYSFLLLSNSQTGSLLEGQDITLSGLAPGNHSLQVTNNETGCSRTLSFTIRKGQPVFTQSPKALLFSSELLNSAYGSYDRLLLNWQVQRNGTLESAPTTYQGFSLLQGQDAATTVFGITGDPTQGETFTLGSMVTLKEYQGQAITIDYQATEPYYVQVYDPLCGPIQDLQGVQFVQPAISISLAGGNVYTRCTADQPIGLDATFSEAGNFDQLFSLNDGFAWTLYAIADNSETLVGSGELSADSQNKARLQQNFEGLADGAYRLDVRLLGSTTTTDPILNAAIQRVQRSYAFAIETREIQVSLSSKPVTCVNDPNGSVYAVVEGATGTIVYRWYDALDNLVGSTQGVNFLDAGTYYLEVSDASECKSGGERYEVSVGMIPGADDLQVAVDHANCQVSVDLVIEDGTAADYTDRLQVIWYKKYERKIPVWSFFFSDNSTECVEDTNFATRYTQRNSCYSFDRVHQEYITLQKGVSSYTVSANLNSEISPGYEYDIVVAATGGCEYTSLQNVYIPLSDIERQYTFHMRWKTEPMIFTPEAPEKVNVRETTIAAAQDVKTEFRKRAEQCIADAEARNLAAFESLCLTTDLLDEELNISFTQEAYHFTLYYYDRAGNLKKTVPPAGINAFGPGQHSLETSYEYNNRGQLLEQSTPDGGITRFIYNKIGQLRFSQNEKQAAENRFSYSKYDALGRVREVGEAQAEAAADWNELQSIADNDVGASIFPDASVYALSQRTRTFYGDEGANGPQTIEGSSQRYTLNRVSHTLHTNPNGQEVTTYYSYDPHGNVEWLIQHLPGLATKKISYQYDLISGNVLQVSYNEGHIDQFFHRYQYDADNRLVQVETSPNGLLWDADARYDYYVHGPLKRVELGQQKVQGLDYVYTLQGWLKAMNSPTLKPEDDPGQDGLSNGLPADAYGMMLSYYSGDYQNSQVLQNRSTYENTASQTNLYNGNIASWTDGYHNSQSKTNELFNRQFSYDQLNRLVESRYQQMQADGTYSSLADAYRTAYSYDGNGNLQQLERHDAQGRMFDQLSYSYQTGANRLRHVKDAGKVLVGAEDGSIVELGEGETLDLSKLAYNDLQNQEDDNYAYDALGNLLLDKQERIKLEWTVYGKVARVDKYADAALSQLTRTLSFAYDAQGNRISKTVAEYTADGAAIAHSTTTYYVRDAQGNPLAVYEHTDTDGRERTMLSEQPLYGSDRLGMRLPENLVVAQTRRFLDEQGNILANYALETEQSQVQYTGGWLAATQNTEGESQLQWLSPLADGSLQQSLIASLGTAKLRATASLPNGRLSPAYALAVETEGVAYLQLLNAQGSLLAGQSNPPALYAGSPLYMGQKAETAVWVLALGAEGTLLRQDINTDAQDISSPAVQLLTDVRSFSLQQLADSSYLLHALRRVAEGQLQLQSWPLAADGSLAAATRWQSTAFAGASETGVRHQLRLHPEGKLLAVATGLGTADLTYSGTARAGAELRLYLAEGTSQQALYRQSLASDASRLDALAWQADGESLLLGLSRPESLQLHTLQAWQLAEEGLQLIASQASEGPLHFMASDRQLYASISTDEGMQNYRWTANSLQPAFSKELLATAAPLHSSQLLISTEPQQQYARRYGLKRYELKDHLGNVRATLSDRLLANSQGSLSAEVQSYANYYPFGWGMPGLEGNADSYRYGFQGQEEDSETGLVNYKYRMHDPRTGRFFAVDPLAAKYSWNSPYAFSENRVVDGIELEGLEYKPTKDKNGTYTGFEWDPENAYDGDGELKDGYYETAILFKDHGTWTVGTWQEDRQRYSSLNIGSATATVYYSIEEADEAGNTTLVPKLVDFAASTMPADPNRFGTIAPGLYQAVRHKHKGDYWALQIRTLDGLVSLPSIGLNPSSGKSTVTGVNIHKAGNKNYTGSLWSKKDFFYTTATGTIYTPKLSYRYGGVSEGCQLIDVNSWDSFMSHFPSGTGNIGVIINRPAYDLPAMKAISNPDESKFKGYERMVESSWLKAMHRGKY